MLFEKIKLEEDEQILLLVRRHWFVLLIRVLQVIAPAFFPIVLITIASASPFTQAYIDDLFREYGNAVLFAGSFWLLFHWMALAYVWTDHYLDLWVITDRRIIAIDQKKLFVRNVGSFRLERLQDMNIEIPGFLATVLDYGNIEAQTASGSEEEFQARNLPKPREIKSLILEVADQRLKHMTHIDRTLETVNT